MSLKEQWKEQIKQEKTKLSQMSGRDRMWYIWEYYKFHILGIILVIGLTVSIGTTIYQNRFDNALYILILNDKGGGSKTEELSLELHDYLKLDDSQQVFVDSSLSATYGDSTTEMGYASMAKITALMATNDLDVMITDEDSIRHFGSLAAYSNLEDELPRELWEEIKGYAYYTEDANGVSYPCAVSLEDTGIPKKYGVIINPPYFAIVSNSEHKEACFSLLRYLLLE